MPGRELKGIHFAMEFLPQQNKRIAGDDVPDQILATGKRVVIIGGGDTGADCLGTCHRQQAKSVRQFEIMPMPPQERASQHALAAVAAATAHRKRARGRRRARLGRRAPRNFTGDEKGNVKQLHAMRVGLRRNLKPLPGTEFTIDADLVLLALGFHGPGEAGDDRAIRRGISTLAATSPPREIT